MDVSTAKVPDHGSSKQIVCSLTHGKAQKSRRLCVPMDTCIAFSPAALEAKEGTFWALYWGHHLLRRPGKDRAGICGRELVTGVGTRGNQLCMKYLTQNPLEEKSSDKIIWDGMIIPLIIPLNEEMVELVGHHKLFHGLHHLPVAILGAASSQLQSCSSGGNWQSCVLLCQGQWPCKANHRTPWPCQDGWSRAVHVNSGVSFREYPWTLMAPSFFLY